jgi:hypothetical protein
MFGDRVVINDGQFYSTLRNFLLVLYEAKHNGIVLHVNFPIPDGKVPSLLFSPCDDEIGLYTTYMENEF